MPGLNVPRLSCAVVLLERDPDDQEGQEEGECRFVLAQHYFRVPLSGARVLKGKRRVRDFVADEDADSDISEDEEEEGDGNYVGDEEEPGTSGLVTLPPGYTTPEDEEDAPLLNRMWYVSRPFSVVCASEGGGADGEEDLEERPLIAADFGCAVWLAYADWERERKEVKFVTFPSFKGKEETKMETEGEVRVLPVPPEVDLDKVETINVDQSHGTVILTLEGGKIFILYYE